MFIYICVLFFPFYCGCFFEFLVNEIALLVRWPACHASLMQVLYIFYTDFTFRELESLTSFLCRVCLISPSVVSISRRVREGRCL